MHIYEKDGRYLPSVTTILHFVTIDADRLLMWSNSLGFRRIKYDEELNRRAEFGTVVHEALERIMSKKPDGILHVNALEVSKLKSIISNFMEFINYNKLSPDDTLHTEISLGSSTLGYAGTCDWIGMFNGKLTLLDYKTSKKPNETMYMQLAAYNELLKESGIYIEQAGILTVGEKNVKLYMKTLEELNEYYKTFEIIHSLYLRMMPYSKLEEAAKQLNNLISCERND